MSSRAWARALVRSAIGWRAAPVAAVVFVFGIFGMQGASASSWLPYVGQPATAQTTGFASITGTNLRFTVEPAGSSGQPPTVFVMSQPGSALSIAPGLLTSDVARQTYRANWRIRASVVSTLAPTGISQRILQTPDAALRATMYLQNIDPATVPNGAPAAAPGLSLQVQSNLAGSGGRASSDVSLLGTQFQVGRATMAFDRWCDLELEFVRGSPGRLVLSINGQVVTGISGFDASMITDAAAAQLFTLQLPAWAGIRWDVGEQSLVTDQAKVYSRGGRVFNDRSAVARMVMVPAEFDLPWASFDAPQGSHQGTIIAAASGGLQPLYRRLQLTAPVAGQTATTTWNSATMELYAPNEESWSTIVLREMLVPLGARVRVLAGDPSGEAAQQRFDLEIRDGSVWHGGIAVAAWPHAARCAVLLHSKLESGQVFRAISVVDLSAEELSSGTIRAAVLPALAMESIGPERLRFEVESVGSGAGQPAVEIAGFAVARWVDVVLTDSYVTAFATGITPKLVVMSRLAAAQFAGYESDLVPGRPLRIEPGVMGEADRGQDWSGPMYLVPAGRSGRRLSDFVRTNMSSAGAMRGVRWFLHAGYVNELSSQLGDPYIVNSDQRARQKTTEIGNLLQEFLTVTTLAGHRWVISSATPTLHIRSDVHKTASFAYYDQVQQRLMRGADLSGRVRFARIGNQLTLGQQDALLSGDLVHYSAVGDMDYARAMFAELARSRVPACSGADMGGEGASEEADGRLDNNDFVVFIQRFFESDLQADLGSQGGAPRGDAALDNNDFVVFINEFFAGCD